jgi:hypothetical protein
MILSALGLNFNWIRDMDLPAIPMGITDKAAALIATFDKSRLEGEFLCFSF